MKEEYDFNNGEKNPLFENDVDIEKSIYNMLARFKKENIYDLYTNFTKDMNLLIGELKRHKLIDENCFVDNVIDTFETVAKSESHKQFIDKITNNDGELICAMFLGLYDNEN